jgi:hypothetical protein
VIVIVVVVENVAILQAEPLFARVNRQFTFQTVSPSKVDLVFPGRACRNDSWISRIVAPVTV